jgi:hypothetical protein
MAERLDGVSSTSPEDMTELLVGLVGEPSYEAAVDERFHALEKYYLDSDGDMWSRYERPDHRRRLAGLVTRIEAAAAERGYPIARRPVIGTLDTGDINAQAHPGPPGEGHLVVFESGMFGFSQLLAKIAVQAIDARFNDNDALVFLGPGGITANVARRPAILGQFADLMFSQAVLGSCMFVDAYDVAPEHLPLSESFSEDIDIFVLAHEYGHVVLGHADLPRLREDAAQAHRLELEADRVGLELAATAIGARHWAFAGASLFLAGVETVLRATSTFLIGRDEVPASPTHPSPAERRARLTELLPAGADPRMVTPMLRMTETMATSLDRLWAFQRPAFERGHQHGYPPAGYRPGDEYEKRAALQSFMMTGLGPAAPAS